MWVGVWVCLLHRIYPSVSLHTLAHTHTHTHTHTHKAFVIRVGPDTLKHPLDHDVSPAYSEAVIVKSKVGA